MPLMEANPQCTRLATTAPATTPAMALQNAETLNDVADHMAANTPVLNALNTRYVIVDENYPPIENYAAQGPAWFVSELVPAATPDEEIALLGSVDLRTQAVISGSSSIVSCEVEESPVIEMTFYTPNEVRYRYSAESATPAVFSEVYYPNGWKATVSLIASLLLLLLLALAAFLSFRPRR